MSRPVCTWDYATSGMASSRFRLLWGSFILSVTGSRLVVQLLIIQHSRIFIQMMDSSCSTFFPWTTSEQLLPLFPALIPSSPSFKVRPTAQRPPPPTRCCSQLHPSLCLFPCPEFTPAPSQPLQVSLQLPKSPARLPVVALEAVSHFYNLMDQHILCLTNDLYMRNSHRSSRYRKGLLCDRRSQPRVYRRCWKDATCLSSRRCLRTLQRDRARILCVGLRATN